MPDILPVGGGIFEITDYTTASDWERFVATLEEILTEWNLIKHSEKATAYQELPESYISSGLWHEKHDVVKFGNVTFDLRYQYLDDSSLNKCNEELNEGRSDASGTKSTRAKHSAIISSSQDYTKYPSEEIELSITTREEKEHSEHELPQNLPECLLDMVATSNDFASKAHCLVRWYNLRRFVLLMPRGDTIISEDRVKLVQSSASVALANIDCHLPVFVQTHNPKNNFYQGISEHHNIRTMYDMVLQKRNVEQYGYLSELISLFREKTGCNLTDPISATIRLNYCLDHFELFVPPSEEFSGNEHSSDDDQTEISKRTAVRRKQSKLLPKQDMRSCATFDQVKEALPDCLPHPYRILRFLHVAALWPPVSDKVITDSRVHSDLDPAEAPVWTIRCVTSDNCNLKIVHETQALNELLIAAIDYAYDKLDGSQVFTECTRDSLKEQCLKLSYQLSTQPEVILSKNPCDSIRKLIALAFYRAAELRAELDALDQIAGQLKKRPSLSEMYRDFKRIKPSVKEFIIRTQISRPFNPISTPALPQRMFCTICDEEFRLCGAFSELCN